MNSIIKVRHQAMQALKPLPVQPLAEWIEANIYFPATVSPCLAR
ncbi:hypothetical protein [Pseudomonas sp. GX19020]|nr:hypothetical protein [Pseudomonas sp. GX19020]